MIDVDDNADVVGELQASLCFYEHYMVLQWRVHWSESWVLVRLGHLGHASWKLEQVYIWNGCH